MRIWKALLLVVIAMCLISTKSFSQGAPNGISYQAVARQWGGTELVQADLQVKVSILSQIPSGELVLEEVHEVTTNEFGLFNIIIGRGLQTGSAQFFDLVAIPWGQTSYFLRIDIAKGTSGNFQYLGTTQLLTVPYAYYSENAGHAASADSAVEVDGSTSNETIEQLTLTGTTLHVIEAGTDYAINLASLTTGGVADDDSDPENELIEGLTYSNDSLFIVEGGITSGVGISMTEMDGDTSNEVITDVTFTGSDLTITEAGVAHTATFTEQDGDPTNELVSGMTYLNGMLYLIEGPSTFSTTISEVDGDVTNELISNLEIQNDSLFITEGANTLSVPLQVLNASPWSEQDTAVYVLNQAVGINASTPTSSLEVNGSMALGFRKYIVTASLHDFFLSASNNVVVVDVTEDDAVVHLPNPTTCSGRVYTIRKYFTNIVANQLEVVSENGGTIDGISSFILNHPNPEYLQVISDGTSWYVIMHSFQ